MLVAQEVADAKRAAALSKANIPVPTPTAPTAYVAPKPKVQPKVTPTAPLAAPAPRPATTYRAPHQAAPEPVYVAPKPKVPHQAIEP